MTNPKFATFIDVCVIIRELEEGKCAMCIVKSYKKHFIQNYLQKYSLAANTS